MRLQLFACLLLCLSPAGLAVPHAPQETSPVEASPAPQLDIKNEIDRSIRWLRAQQDADGSYGASVKSTAWVLQALAMSPRHYVRRDGPFVAGALDYLAAHQHPKTGGIFDSSLDESDVDEAHWRFDYQRTAQSVLSWLALQQYSDATSAQVLQRLKGFFENPLQPSKSKVWDRARADKELDQWIAVRKPDASWTGKDGSIIRTAQGVIALSQCYGVLNKPAAPAGTTQRLPKFNDADRAQTVACMQRGALFLIAASEDGLWGAPGQPELGVTSMALGALQELPTPRPADIQQVIDHGLDWLVTHQDNDGSIHDGKLKNYLTSSAILALAKSGNERYAQSIERARQFLVALQADEGEGYTDGDLYYGGIGYGGDERPDLSNLQMALEALAAAGTKPGDKSFSQALKFLERTQNRSESNDLELVEKGVTIKSGNDGGAGYAPGTSKAGFDVLADGTQVPRSYGSMTYALLKGFIFAGLPPDDPRMQAAWTWICKHYTLDVNPGFEATGDPAAPYRGLYYYFHTMAKALDLYGQEMVVDTEGHEHPWRRELCGRLIAMQRKDDGSWINENAPSWWEGNPVLASSYALLSLGTALPKN